MGLSQIEKSCAGGKMQREFLEECAAGDERRAQAFRRLTTKRVGSMCMIQRVVPWEDLKEEILRYRPALATLSVHEISVDQTISESLSTNATALEKSTYQ